MKQPLEARRWLLAGQIQGVGFRPFVFRIACNLGLTGWVINRVGQVEIHTEGPPEKLERFGQLLLERPPPLARPHLLRVRHCPLSHHERFSILHSEGDGEADIHLPPDCFTCDDCLRELSDPEDRRYRYPFINCTQCGPRYTLITALPYDRPNTSMAGFPLCPACRKEYENPADRRFHAEPIACPACGPRLWLTPLQEETNCADTEAALRACVALLKEGRIVAVKGIGGYHLMCDARNDEAIERLRERKPRPHKPLAVMFPAPTDDPLRLVSQAVQLDEMEQSLLPSPIRPIVLARNQADSPLSPGIAPGLDETGVMLPYSPLHHLLLNDFGGPLVATSGNVGGEPVITDQRLAEQRLRHIADAFLHHDRPIVRPADDPVFRSIRGRPRPLRLGRGCAPLEFSLPMRLAQPCIAVGGHMKNSVALAWEDRVVLSPHIGDMGSARSVEVFERVIEDLQRLYGVRAERVIADAHPGYAPTRWARRHDLPVSKVFHHAAHASALAGERGVHHDWLVFTWDGVGLGEDGTLWGGEALAGRPGAWQRVASLRPFHLPGGDRVAREPWRSALAICWEIGREWQPPHQTNTALTLLHRAWQRRFNTEQSSAAGRLFDAAAAIAGVCFDASFEGQGPMWLEALCNGQADPVELPMGQREDGLWVTDWQPLFEALLDNAWSAGEQAACLHATLAEAITRQAIRIRQQRPVEAVGLSGGVFQNRLLCEWTVARLEASGFRVWLNERVPSNDGGLAFGQVIEQSAREKE